MPPNMQLNWIEDSIVQKQKKWFGEIAELQGWKWISIHQI